MQQMYLPPLRRDILLFKLSPFPTLFITSRPCTRVLYAVKHWLLLIWGAWLASRLDRFYIRTQTLDYHLSKFRVVPSCCGCKEGSEGRSRQWTHGRLFSDQPVYWCPTDTENKHNRVRHRDNLGLTRHLVTLLQFVPWIDRLCFHGNHSKILLPDMSTSFPSVNISWAHYDMPFR